MASQCLKADFIKYSFAIYSSSESNAGQITAWQLPMKRVNLLRRWPQPIFEHEGDRLVNSLGDFLGPKIIFALMSQRFTSDQNRLNVTILHRNVLFSSHEASLDWSLPYLRKVLFDWPFNDSVVAFKKLFFINVRGPEVIKIKLIPSVVVGVVGGVGVTLHDSHFEQLLEC